MCLHREKIMQNTKKTVELIKDDRTCLEFEKVAIQINL
jgi:hypothetical protein